MNCLRQRLLKESPPLHAALERSWEIAREKWLSSISPSAGSYNSGPHFLNIEAHLEGLLCFDGQNTPGKDLAIPLTCLELYLLLASVLFHDVGRVRGDINHAYKSYDLLHDDYPFLGIPSYELACSLGRIAIYHDPVKKQTRQEREKADEVWGKGDEQAIKTLKAEIKEKEEREIREAKKALVEVIIEPYGRARELTVATLLALADHLDASARRTEPEFVRPDDEINFKGAFRRMILGSSYDRVARSIKTCLHNPRSHEKEDPKGPQANADLLPFVLKQGGNKIPMAKAMKTESRLECPLYAEMKIQPSRPRKLFKMCLASEKYFLDRDDQEQSGPWPQDYILAIVLRDLKHNRDFLNRVKDDLKQIGLPVEKWQVEFAGKTYKNDGSEEPEPIFSDSNYLKTVAENMLELSRFAFVRSLFSYEVLADSMREANVEKVKLAVRRLKQVPQDIFIKKHLEVGCFPMHWELRKIKAKG